MTDSPGDVPERNDPVLVRPYVSTGSDEPGQPAGAEETWPAEPGLPAAEQPTAIQPAVAPPEEHRAAEHHAEKHHPGEHHPGEHRPPEEPRPPASPRIRPAKGRHPVHWAIRLLVLLLGVAVALAIAGYFVLGGGSRDDAPRGPSAALPVVNPPAPAEGGATSAARPSASASHSASAGASATASSAPTPSATQPAATTTAVRKPTLAPPPAAARTGAISAAGGRCLALGGLLGIDGSPIETASCSGGASQKFTLASDGTLRVASRCATAGGDGSVRSGACGAAGASGQWRAGPDGTLVNPSSGRCLTDPGTAGTVTTVTACTGGGNQRWSLP